MFIAKVKANIPYPKEFEYRIKATQFSAAASRAVRAFRKDMKGKRVKVMTIQLIKV